MLIFQSRTLTRLLEGALGQTGNATVRLVGIWLVTCTRNIVFAGFYLYSRCHNAKGR